jgi:hypothetical protein
MINFNYQYSNLLHANEPFYAYKKWCSLSFISVHWLLLNNYNSIYNLRTPQKISRIGGSKKGCELYEKEVYCQIFERYFSRGGAT